jgi:hypothetical protein
MAGRSNEARGRPDARSALARALAPKEEATQELVNNWYVKAGKAAKAAKAKVTSEEMAERCRGTFIPDTCADTWLAHAWKHHIPREVKHTGRPRKAT